MRIKLTFYDNHDKNRKFSFFYIATYTSINAFREIEIFLLKKKNIYIAWGSLSTIRITKDGHDERQRRREKEGGRRGLEREKKFNYKHGGGRDEE